MPLLLHGAEAEQAYKYAIEEEPGKVQLKHRLAVVKEAREDTDEAVRL